MATTLLYLNYFHTLDTEFLTSDLLFHLMYLNFSFDTIK